MIETLNVQIVMDLIAVLVNKDSLEMAQHVTVSEDIIITSKSHLKN